MIGRKYDQRPQYKLADLFPQMKDKVWKKLQKLDIGFGSHNSPADGVCIMEAFALVTEQEHTDSPICASQVLTSASIEVNDAISDNEERNKLKPLVLILLGTAPTRIDEVGVYNLNLGKTVTEYWEVQDRENLDYIALEGKRRARLRNLVDRKTDGNYQEIGEAVGADALTTEQAIKIIQEVAATK